MNIWLLRIMTNSLTVIVNKCRNKRLTGNGTNIMGDEKWVQHLQLENTEKKLLARPQHRQNYHKEVRYEGENVILAHKRVQWQALMNIEMILPVLERWEISWTDYQLLASQKELSLSFVRNHMHYLIQHYWHCGYTTIYEDTMIKKITQIIFCYCHNNCLCSTKSYLSC
jgi:hypothetical protein